MMRRAAVLACPRITGRDGNRDGLPTVLLEAMALGTPVIATDVTGIPELVRDGDTGLCVTEGDPVALADGLARLLGSHDLRLKLAAAGRRAIERDFDITANAAVLRSLFFDTAPGTASRSEVA
jgi:glycosyltransferase involved in cell wall biosynthesis